VGADLAVPVNASRFVRIPSVS